MFNNPGKKIKILATVMFWLEVVGSVITAIVMAANDDPVFLLLAPAGFASAWLLSLFVYAFGELVEKATSIDEKMDNKSAPVQPVKEVEDLPEI